jgi:hypothetical protein
LFNALTKNNSSLEKEVVKRLEIQNMAAKDDA